MSLTCLSIWSLPGCPQCNEFSVGVCNFFGIINLSSIYSKSFSSKEIELNLSRQRLSNALIFAFDGFFTLAVSFAIFRRLENLRFSPILLASSDFFEVFLPVNRLVELLCPVLTRRFVCMRSLELCACTLLLRLSSRLNFIHCRPLIGQLNSSAKLLSTLFTWFTVNQLFHNSAAFTLSPVCEGCLQVVCNTNCFSGGVENFEVKWY